MECSARQGAGWARDPYRKETGELENALGANHPRCRQRTTCAQSCAKWHRVQDLLWNQTGIHNCTSGASKRLAGRPTLLRLLAVRLGSKMEPKSVTRVVWAAPLQPINPDIIVPQSLLRQQFPASPHCNNSCCTYEVFSKFHTHLLVSGSRGLMPYMTLTIRYIRASSFSRSSADHNHPDDPKDNTGAAKSLQRSQQVLRGMSLAFS